MARTISGTKARYDWRACGIALTAAFAAAIPAAMLSVWMADSTLLLSAVVTTVGTTVGHWTYARVARPGARPVDDETCSL